MARPRRPRRRRSQRFRSHAKSFRRVEPEVGEQRESDRALFGGHRPDRHDDIADEYHDSDLGIEKRRGAGPTILSVARGEAASRAPLGQRADLRAVRVHVQVLEVLGQEGYIMNSYQHHHHHQQMHARPGLTFISIFEIYPISNMFIRFIHTIQY